MKKKGKAGTGKTHKIKEGVPVHFWLKMEQTDLEKFGDVQVTLLANRRTPAKKVPKGTKPPKNN